MAWASSVNAAATPLYRGGVDREFVVAAAQALQEGVPGNHDLRCAITAA